jgi:RNA polymerase sigma factor (sigma-70 family)
MDTQRTPREIQLAKRIEAGLLAAELLGGQPGPVGATPQELQTLVDEGRDAQEELVLTHLGLVHVIAAEAARRRHTPFRDVFQDGCVALQQAVMSYDWRKGPFGPYAGMWIRAAVRRKDPRAWVSLEQVEVVDTASVGALAHHETRQGLDRALAAIPRYQGEVVRLRTGWQGRALSLRETAGQLGVSVAQVRLWERDGLQALRDRWRVADAA